VHLLVIVQKLKKKDHDEYIFCVCEYDFLLRHMVSHSMIDAFGITGRYPLATFTPVSLAKCFGRALNTSLSPSITVYFVVWYNNILIGLFCNRINA